MPEEAVEFGAMLRRLIKEAGMTQEVFYKQINIKKPYFYDILKGSPPPPELQIKCMDVLDADLDARRRFYDLSALLRNEVPADVSMAINKDPGLIKQIRALMDSSSKKGEQK